MANGDEAGAYSASFRCRVCRVDYRVTDIEDLLTRPEGKRLEYKRDLSLPGPVMRALTAFANSAGGVLVFGVEMTARFEGSRIRSLLSHVSLT